MAAEKIITTKVYVDGVLVSEHAKVKPSSPPLFLVIFIYMLIVLTPFLAWSMSMSGVFR